MTINPGNTGGGTSTKGSLGPLVLPSASKETFLQWKNVTSAPGVTRSPRSREDRKAKAAAPENPPLHEALGDGTRTALPHIAVLLTVLCPHCCPPCCPSSPLLSFSLSFLPITVLLAVLPPHGSSPHCLVQLVPFGPAEVTRQLLESAVVCHKSPQKGSDSSGGAEPDPLPEGLLTDTTTGGEDQKVQFCTENSFCCSK